MRTVIIFLIFLTSCATTKQVTGESSLGFSVEVACVDDKENINLELVNNSESNIGFDDEKSPWIKNKDTVTYRISEVKNEDLFQVSSGWQKRKIKAIEIKSKQTLRKSVPLDIIFDDFQISENKEYLLNWTYRNPLDTKRSYGGGVVFRSCDKH